jgi:hypothetical protein
MDADAAQAWFIAGTIPVLLAGGLHALLTLVDVVRPTHFAPVEPSVQAGMAATGMRFSRRAGGNGTRLSMWNAWLGFNISHGLGIFAFALLCLLIATSDFALVERMEAIRFLTVAIPAIYVVVALRFWFWGPVLIASTSTACFAVSAVLAA